MDTEEKVIAGIITLALAILLTLTLAVNIRWMSNKADYYELQRTMVSNGYIQKQVPSEMTTIWVKGPNAK